MIGILTLSIHLLDLLKNLLYSCPAKGVRKPDSCTSVK